MKVFIFLLAIFGIFAIASGNVALRSTAIKGTLNCGANPAENVHVRLLRVFVDPKAKEENVAKEVLDSRITGPSGQFEVNGNTNGRALNETNIEPSIAIYHQCDDAKDTKGFRRFLIKVPEKFVTVGRNPKKTYDIGDLNLQITYPGEIRDKNFKPAN
ncbi:hypothetical protein FO519_003807 [Halicephalobus sp. NKZ332]|nr:hypothetical protein FO519_003807 [Halicephalobus sp. NKZ332]